MITGPLPVGVDTGDQRKRCDYKDCRYKGLSVDKTSSRLIEVVKYRANSAP